MHYSISHFSLLPNTSSHSHICWFSSEFNNAPASSVPSLVLFTSSSLTAEPKGHFTWAEFAAQWGAAILPAMTVTRMAKQPNTRSVNKQNMAENRSTGLSYHLSSLKLPFWVQLWSCGQLQYFCLCLHSEGAIESKRSGKWRWSCIK